MTRPIFVFLVLLLCYAVAPLTAADEGEFFKRRQHMVNSQIVARGVRDKRVIEAMLKVPRHKFVPPAIENMTYIDSPLPIGEGQTISQPYIVALMTEALGLKGDERVLEIGTGSGYQAAVLAELAKEVYTVEIIKPLADKAKRRLEELGYKNVYIRCGDGYQGWPEYAPFDAIIVTCAPEEIPEALIEQLKDPAVLVSPVGPQEAGQVLVRLKKRNGKITSENITYVRFVPMIKGIDVPTLNE